MYLSDVTRFRRHFCIFFGSGFGSCTGFGSGQNLVPVSAQFLKLNFGSVPVSVDFPVPVDTSCHGTLECRGKL